MCCFILCKANLPWNKYDMWCAVSFYAKPTSHEKPYDMCVWFHIMPTSHKIQQHMWCAASFHTKANLPWNTVGHVVCGFTLQHPEGWHHPSPFPPPPHPQVSHLTISALHPPPPPPPSRYITQCFLCCFIPYSASAPLPNFPPCWCHN